MPVTISYDLSGTNSNDRNYIRSMLERFGWKRMGGSVFRYSGRTLKNAGLTEDWLNDIVPALMFFRSFVLNHNLKLTRFTVDASGVSFLDHSGTPKLGKRIASGTDIDLATPTNSQSSAQVIRAFIDTSTTAT